ncbi:hypothetical protein EV702DRAFT_1266070 [Suillus placidus]|uniref:Uncharacterized protein n=1 Tax=Suillus placidus TaxID=48579 RepID=A0A9P7D7D2_9AGAM|nr:hypothetical protein EV702DRAFT_1266070 [Suillus placidus]
MLDQLVPVNQEVLDDDIRCASGSPSSSLPRTDEMNSTMYPNHGFVVTHSTMISSPNHPGQPDLYGPRTWDDLSSSTGYSCYDNAQQHYSIQSAPTLKPQDISISPPQTIYSASSTFGCFRSPAMRSDSLSLYAPPTWYSDVHRSPPGVLLYNEPLYQWQNSAIPPSGPLISTQPHASHSGNMYHPSDQPATIILHSPFSADGHTRTQSVDLQGHWRH